MTEAGFVVLVAWAIAAGFAVGILGKAVLEGAQIRPVAAPLFAAALGAPIAVELIAGAFQLMPPEASRASVGLGFLGLLILPVALVDAVRRVRGKPLLVRMLLVPVILMCTTSSLASVASAIFV